MEVPSEFTVEFDAKEFLPYFRPFDIVKLDVSVSGEEACDFFLCGDILKQDWETKSCSWSR